MNTPRDVSGTCPTRVRIRGVSDTSTLPLKECLCFLDGNPYSLITTPRQQCSPPYPFFETSKGRRNASLKGDAQGWEVLLEAMKKARRLNNHVFSMLKARCPLEDKQACAIKQSGAPLHRIKFENTVSAFETLPQKVPKIVVIEHANGLPSFFMASCSRDLVACALAM
ncbi:transcription activator [Actinidia rufa]|uniref:Transcription activator n=1 Tax=Actinidia rufa TaxID=165716 RepID=A0A7J0DZI4_9ERIC|nr:transcription activator [Actinidia rufa]